MQFWRRFIKFEKSIRKSGFTLVELMVVVAIIGVLSAVAVPNFKNYMAKARKSEAKLLLAGVYTTEQQDFYSAGTYATCIGDMGYDPGATNSRYYAIGFKTTSGQNATYNTAMGGSACNTAAATVLRDYFVAGKSAGGSAITVLVNNTSATSSSFTASAEGRVSANGNDLWTVTETKAIVNSTPTF